MPNYQGQIVDTTHSGGLSVGEYWVSLFERNEQAFDSGKWDEVLTDEEIIERMSRAFPRRKRPTQARVMKARLQYESPQGLPGSVSFFRYLVDSKNRICRCSARGRVIQVGGRRKRDQNG